MVTSSVCYEWKHFFFFHFSVFHSLLNLNGRAAVLFNSENQTGAAERRFWFMCWVGPVPGSRVEHRALRFLFSTEQGACLRTALLHYLLIFSLTLAFLSNMYYYFFRGLLAALMLQALQNKCDASEGGGAQRQQGFMGNMIQFLRKLNTTCVEHL